MLSSCTKYALTRQWGGQSPTKPRLSIHDYLLPVERNRLLLDNLSSHQRNRLGGRMVTKTARDGL
jgi:hypothetical protein